MKQQSLKEVQKKLQIISNALEKEKQKSKTCLKTLKDYENLAREKEDQINDIKRAIIDINEQIRIQQNQETEKTMSSKVTNLFGSFFSKNIESSQKLENLEEELKNQKEENKKLVDKFCKLKELNSEQRIKFEAIINNQKENLNELIVKNNSTNKQNESIKITVNSLQNKINEYENDKKKKEEEIKNMKSSEEIDKIVLQNLHDLEDLSKKSFEKDKEIKNIKLKIQEVEKQITKLDDGISNLSENFPCDKEFSGFKERIKIFFGRNYDNNQYTLNLQPLTPNAKPEIIEFKNIISCGRNMSNKTHFILVYPSGDSIKQYNLIFNESVANIFESNYFTIVASVGDAMS